MTTEHTEKRKILFVDDSRMVRFAARKCLAGDYELVLAVDGQDALNKLAQHVDIRAVVSDLMMPELDGFGLIEAMREHASDRVRKLPVMVVSGSAGARERRRLKTLGVEDMMTKPFREDVLKLRVARLVGEADARPEPAVAEEASKRDAARRIASPVPANVETSRARFVGRLRQALALHVRHKLPLSILQIRLANAEALDREFGAGGARAAMRLVEHLILRTVRVEDTVGRIGPTERTVLLPATTVEGTRALRRRLRNALTAHQCTIGGKRPEIRLDFLVHTPKPDLDAASLLKEARPAKLLDNVVVLPARIAG